MLRSLTGGGSGGNGQAMPGGRPLPAIIRRAVCYSGLPRLMRHVQRDDCTVVAYHGVIPDELWRGWIMADMIPLSLFRRQLQFYRRHYNVIGLRELVSGLSSPGGKLPPRSMAITFDDGYRNNLQVALPALTAAKMPATIFVTSGFIDGKTEFWWLRLKKVFAAAMGRRSKVQLLPGLALATDNAQHAYLNYRLALRTLKAMPASERLEILDRLSADFPMTYDADVAALFEPLSWAEVEQIHAQGFEVGAHTVTHPILSQETGEAAAWEIRESVGCIRQRLNVDEVAFSYPNGQWLDFTVTLEAVIRDAGCYCAVASVPGANRRGDDPYALRRLPIGGQHSMAAVELEACGVNELLQTVRRIPSRLVRRGAGGRKNINHSATVKADGRTGSAAAPIVTAAAAIGADEIGRAHV